MEENLYLEELLERCHKAENELEELQNKFVFACADNKEHEGVIDKLRRTLEDIRSVADCAGNYSRFGSGGALMLGSAIKNILDRK